MPKRDGIVRLRPMHAIGGCLVPAECGIATSSQINAIRTPAELARFDDVEICNPLVKPATLVERERKRRPCDQYRRQVGEGKRPDPAEKCTWTLLPFLPATPAGA